MATTYILISSSLNETRIYDFDPRKRSHSLLKYKNTLYNNNGVSITPDFKYLVLSKNQLEICIFPLNSDPKLKENEKSSLNIDLNQNEQTILLPIPKRFHKEKESIFITCILIGKKSSRFIYVAVILKSSTIAATDAENPVKHGQRGHGGLTGASNSNEDGDVKEGDKDKDKRRDKSYLLTWDRKENKYCNAPLQFQAQITRMAITTDDQKIACTLAARDSHSDSSNSNGDSIAIYSVKYNTISYIASPFLSTATITCLDFYPFKKSVLVAGGDDGSIATWDLNTSTSPYNLKKHAHSKKVTSICFAPCNKHFYCSIGLDGKILFHDMNNSGSGGSGKGLLQSFQTDHPLLSLTINDEHTVAMGDIKGNILVYDLRQKKLIDTIESPTNDPITHLVFQPPKWSIAAAASEVFEVDFGVAKVDSKQVWGPDNTLQVISSHGSHLQTPVLPHPQPSNTELTNSNSSTAITDIFSPVNARALSLSSKPAAKGDLRRAAAMSLFQEKLRNSKENTEIISSVNDKESSFSTTPVTLQESKDKQVFGPEIKESTDQETPRASSLISSQQPQDLPPSNHQKPPVNHPILDHQPSEHILETPTLVSSTMRTREVDEYNPAPSSSCTPSHPVLDTPVLALPPTTTNDILQESMRRAGLVGLPVGGLTGDITPSAYLRSSVSKATHHQPHNSDSSALQYKVIRGIVEQVIAEHHTVIKADIQNLHLEVLRQSQQQKIEFQEMIEEKFEKFFSFRNGNGNGNR